MSFQIQLVVLLIYRALLSKPFHLLSNQGVQLTPLARLLGWARFTRQNAPACWQRGNPQPSDAVGVT